MGEVIKFPSAENSSEQLPGLADLQLAIKNLFYQTANPDRKLNDQRVIAEVKNETGQIAEKIATLVEDIDGISPNMLTEEQFAEEAWVLLCTPLQYGTDRVAVDYYGTQDCLNTLHRQYSSKMKEVKNNALGAI